MARRKDVNWSVPEADQAIYFEQAQLAVLMDIRDELKAVNTSLGCFRVRHALDNLNSVATDLRRRDRLRRKRNVNARRKSKAAG